MKTLLMSLIIIFLTASCSKTEVKGYVYSKHGFPIANGAVILNETLSQGGYQSGVDKTVATTDNNGYYFFKFKSKRNKQYTVRCKSDSGLALGGFIRDNKTNLIILDTY